MVEKRLDELIVDIVKSEANNNPAPVRCSITKVYDDNKHTDIEIKEGKLKYVETIGNNLAVGNIGVLFVLEDETFIMITK